MNRDTASPGWASRVKSARKFEHCKLNGLEPLEDRKMLAATYYNDNWTFAPNQGPTLEFGDRVRTTETGSLIEMEYGVTAFGSVAGLSIAQYSTIHSAIQATPNDGISTLHIMPGTHKESDIVIDRSMTVLGKTVSGQRATIIVPETASAKADGNFPVGTHSAFIINAPNVTIETLQIDGDGNNTALGGSMHFHHGITNIFDTQNGGNYQPVRGNAVAPNNLSADDQDSNIRIRNLDVKNTYWHGITLSGVSATNMRNNRIQNVTVTNVGMPGARDVHRVGIQIMNQINTDILSSTVSNVGVGIESATFGPFSFDSNDLGRNNSGFRLNSVTNADQRAYSVINSDGGIDLNFILTEGATFIGFDANKANYTSTSNNAIGLYINNSQTIVAGFESTNAKIGMKVENTKIDGLRLPVVLGSTILGPGVGVAGSYGILADNVGDTSNPASFGISGATKISGFQTGLRMNQETPLAEKNRAQIDRVNLSGNGTAISVGNNSLLQGNTNMTDSVVLNGNGAIEPGFPDSFVVREGADDWAGPYADIFKTGSVTLNSSATLDMRLAGQTGNSSLFDFNENVGALPWGAIPPAPENGGTYDPYGSSIAPGAVLQNGVFRMDGPNGQLTIAYGTLNHPDPNEAGRYILDPVDISNGYSKLDVVVKLGATNQSKAFIFGLVDTDGQVALFVIGNDGLSTTTYTTVSINLAAPGIPFSLGDDGDFDLDKVMGWAVLGDVGLINGAINVPMSIIIDQVNAGSILNSQLNVTGTVNLAGATLNLQLGEGFTPSIGQSFTIINNDGVDAVQGKFAQGSQATIGGLTYSINYAGGDGNDVVLTRIPDVVDPVPTVQSINRTTPAGPNTGAGSVTYTVNFSEAVTGVDATDFALALTGATTATTPVVVSGSGATYTVTVNGISGAGTLGLNLVNNNTIKDSANQSITAGFTGQVYTITAAPGNALITGRHIFYNNSKFDGSTLGVDVQDDAAIAIDKVAFKFASGTANAPVTAFTSYSRGINGIMVDIKNAATTPILSDFTFKVGANGTVSSWVNAPAPTAFSVRPGAGVDGADRVEIIWADNAIQNSWLQVIVEGNDTVGGNNTRLGLNASDTFFYGNRIGDTFVSPPAGSVTTTAADGLAARGNIGPNRPITNIYDFDRSRSVTAADELVSRANSGTLTRNLTWNPPAGPLAVQADDDSSGAIASALAAKSSTSSPKVPSWISERLASVDLNSGPVAKLFTALADANTPKTRALLQAANDVTDALDLDDSLLESLIAGLN